MSTAEYPPTLPFQRIWSPSDSRDTVRDALQLAALKRLHQELDDGITVWDHLVCERALLRNVPHPVGRLTSIDQLLTGWPARIIVPVVCP